MRRKISIFSFLILYSALCSAFICFWIIPYFGNSENLSCIKLEPKHISCELQKSHWYGLTSTPTEKFRLTRADIKERVGTDDNNIKYYQLVLYEHNKSFLFYEHRPISLINN